MAEAVLDGSSFIEHLQQKAGQKVHHEHIQRLQCAAKAG